MVEFNIGLNTARYKHQEHEEFRCGGGIINGGL